MIKKLTFKFGHVPGAAPEAIDVTPVTIFVGPNNSGKSKVLVELATHGGHDQHDQNVPPGSFVIADKLTFQGFSKQGAQAYLEMLEAQAPSTSPDTVFVGNFVNSTNVGRANILECLQQPERHPGFFHAVCIRFSILILNGQNRINLSNAQPATDLQTPPRSSFNALFRDDAKRVEVRRIVSEALGLYLVVDATAMTQLRLRLSKTPPESPALERGLHVEAVKFHSEAQLVEEMSDGVRAFTGIIAEVITGDPNILLIDEPEAFLHPSLAYKLGKEMSLASMKARKRLFASTHSSSFVMGCIQSGAAINIVRLTYQGGVATARVLPSEKVQKLMRHPLLRSADVISALFYDFVIVVEADADRAFYQEVNERLLASGSGRGIPRCLFIHAQGKDNIHTILRPLREMGIPAAAILDIDVVCQGKAIWKNLLGSASMPHPLIQSSGVTRDAVEQALKNAGDSDLKKVKDSGVDFLPHASDRETAHHLLDQLATYGIFAVRIGELESWLKHLGVPKSKSKHGPGWLIQVFDKMGENPEDAGYVKPAEDDVWAFIDQVKQWLSNPLRKGIPE